MSNTGKILLYTFIGITTGSALFIAGRSLLNWKKVGEKNADMLKTVNVYFRDRLTRLVAYAKSKGYDVTITSANRTFEKQQQLHKEDSRNAKPGRSMHNFGAACFDDKTEILTNIGWKYFKELGEEKVMVFDGKYTYFEKPNYLISNDYNGEMIGIKTRSVDMLVTPDHNILSKKLKNKSWSDAYSHTLAKDITYRHKIPIVGEYKFPKTTPKYPMMHKYNPVDWWEFMGWWLSEGSACGISDGIKRKHNLRYKVSISQNSEKYEFEKISECLERMKIKYNYLGHEFIIHSKELWEILITIGHQKIRKMPRYLLDAPKYLLKKLYESMLLGDGTNYEKHDVYWTSSPYLRDNFMELCVRLGIPCTWSIKKQNIDYIMPHGKKVSKINTQYFVLTRENTEHELRNGKMPSKNIYKTDYNGIVYCVNTNTGNVVVRRNGKVFISGNCDITLSKDGKHYGKSTSRKDWEDTGIPAYAAKLGLFWGADIPGYHDPVHFQYDKGLGIDKLAELKEKQMVEGNKIKIPVKNIFKFKDAKLIKS